MGLEQPINNLPTPEDAERYQSGTRDRYRNQNYARVYHAGYTSRLGIKNLYTRLIARREIRCVAKALTDSGLCAPKCLDIPCGTGKLAGLLCERASSVVAADVSAEMVSMATQYLSSEISLLVEAEAVLVPFRCNDV